MNIQLQFTFVIFALALVSISCEDPLPPYEKPEKIFEAKFRTINADPVTYTSVLNLEPASYSYTESNPREFYMSVENTYEETIQATTDIEGQLVIWLPEYPDIVATIPLNSNNAAPFNNASIYDDATKLLTLDPHQRIYFRTQWNYKTDDGKYVNVHLPNYTETAVGSRIYRYFDPVQLHARLTIALIKNRSFEVADTTFSLTVTGIYTPTNGNKRSNHGH